jgi:hypothetical protein
VDNFISFKPRQKWIIFQPKIVSNAELNQRLADAGLQVMAYDRRFAHYNIRVSESELDEHIDLVRDIIQMAFAPEER